MKYSLKIRPLRRVDKFNWYRAALVMLPFMVVGFVALRFIFAAGTPVAFESESGNLASGAIITTTAGHSGTGAVQFGVGAPTPSPTGASLTGWQLTRTNIGLAPFGLSCSTLPTYTGSPKPAAGTTITGKLISEPLDLSSGAITITKSCIKGTSIGIAMVVTSDYNGCGNACPAPAKGQVTITDSEIDGSLVGQAEVSHDCAFLGVGILERNYIHDTGSGICFYGTGLAYTATAINNYVERMRAYGDPATTGSHNETFTIRDYNTTANATRRLLVEGNHFDINSGNDSGAVFIQGYGDFIDNVTVQDNLLMGNGYQLALEANNNGYGTHMSAVNNRFSGTGFGPGYVTGGPGWASWTNNYLNDPSKPNNQGAAVSRP